MKTLALILVVAVAGSVRIGRAEQPPLPIHADGTVGQPAAAEKPLCVLVGATWCPACQQMEHRTIPAVPGDVLACVDFFIADVDRRPDWKAKLKTDLIPELIIVEHGRYHYLTGAQTPAVVTAFIEEWSTP